MHLRSALDLLQALPQTRERDERELDLQIALVNPLMGWKGIAAPETDQAEIRALELCERIGESERVFPVLYGRYAIPFVAGQVTESLGIAEEISRRAELQSNPVPKVAAYRSLANNMMLMGRLDDARRQIDLA